MPVLSIDYSKGAATVLSVQNDFTYKVLRIPIPAPDIHYYNRPTRTEVFLNLLSEIERSFNLKIDKKTKVYASALRIPEIEIDNVTFCDKSDAFKSLYPMNFLYFSHLHVGDNRGVYAASIDYKDLLKDIFFDEEENTLINYFENLRLYPFIAASSDRDVYEEIAYLRKIARSSCNVAQKKSLSENDSVILSTTRDISDEKGLCRFMLLCIESVCGEGVYSFKLDFSNFLGAAAALSFIDNITFQKLLLPDLVELGSLINVADDLECVFISDAGIRQEVYIKKNTVFTLPVASYNKMSVKIGSKKYGQWERIVSGGVFGVVVDTREKELNKPLTLEQKKELVKEWEDVLLASVKGL